MKVQLNLFANELKIEEVISFVHSQGLWQTENCFKTEKVNLGDFVRCKCIEDYNE